jgi:hypothetical protein
MSINERIVVITSRKRIRGVAAAWKKQYPKAEPGSKWANIEAELRALDVETATAEDVEAIIGNRSWTRTFCNVCEEEKETIVRLGDVPDYESSTLYACEDCLAAALADIRA